MNNNNPNSEAIDKEQANSIDSNNSTSSKKSQSKFMLKVINFKNKLFKFPYLTSMLIAWIFIVLIIGICISVGLGLI